MRKIYAKTLCLIVGIFLVCGVLPVGHDSLVFLENRFAKPTAGLSHVDGVILLGGAISTDLSSARGESVLSESGARLLAFLQLAHEHPDARLIVTGGSGSLFSQDLKEADYVRDLLNSLGIDKARITYEPKARNTFENAKFVKSLMEGSESETWLLVTSAYHMPRSMGTFRQQGIQPVAYPTGYMTDGVYHIFPRDFDILSQYRYLNIALKEYIGNAAYFMGRKSNSFMPDQHEQM